MRIIKLSLLTYLLSGPVALFLAWKTTSLALALASLGLKDR